jgi:hypothetical protein
LTPKVLPKELSLIDLLVQIQCVQERHSFERRS